MAVPLRYGEPDWNRPPRQGLGPSEILERPFSDKSYEELRYEATQKQWANKFVDLNTMAVSSGADSSFVNLKNLTDVVEVLVGEDDHQACWMVHQKLLTTDSDFAALALKTGFKEHDERRIRLPEESPDVFEQYVKYLYTRCILAFSLELVVQMYTLGDRLQSIKFANACYETIAKSTDPYSPKQIKYIFDNTYSGDRLRKLCTSQVGKGILAGRYSFSTAHEQELLKEFMPELMQGVTAAVAEMRRGGDKWFPSTFGFKNCNPPSYPSGFSFGTPAADPAIVTTNPTVTPTPATSVTAAPRLFGTDPIPSNGPGGPFGGNNNTHDTSSSQTTGGLFGSLTSTSAPFGARPFGQPAAGAGGSAFGATNSTSGGFGSVRPLFGGDPFGATSQPSTGFGSGGAPSGSAFGGFSQAPSGFGSAPSAASNGGLFGTAPTQSADNSSGLFRTVGTNPPSVSGSLFGANPQTASAFPGGTRSTSGGLFPNTTSNPPGDSPFGRPTGVSPFETPFHPPSTTGRSSLFGSQQPTSTNGGLFGSAETSNTSLFRSEQLRTGGLFGTPSQPSATRGFGGFAAASGGDSTGGFGSLGGSNAFGSTSASAFGRPTSAPPGGSLFGKPSQPQSQQDSSTNFQTADQQTQPVKNSHHATESTNPVSPGRAADCSTSTSNTTNTNAAPEITVATPGDKTNGAGNTHPGTANTNPNPLPLNVSSTTSSSAPSWSASVTAPPSSSYPSLPTFAPRISLNSDPKLRTGRNDIPGLHVPVSRLASARSEPKTEEITEQGKSDSRADERFTPTAPSSIASRAEVNNDLEEMDEDMTKAMMNMAFPSSPSEAKNGEKMECKAIGKEKDLEESTAKVKAQLEKNYVSGSYTPFKSKSSETITAAGTLDGAGSTPAATAEDSSESANSSAASAQGEINRDGDVCATSKRLNPFGGRFD